MSIIDNVKEVADLIQKVGDMELYRKIVDLKAEIVELSRNNMKLEQENSELRAKLEIKENMEFRQPFYFLGDDKIPYCPLCWESEQKAIHLMGPKKTPHKNNVWYRCPNCENNFDDPIWK